MIGTTLGPYRIVAKLGEGGMGEVYRARDARLERDVAVKVLSAEFANDPDRLRRFELEARAAGQLNHSNILSVFDVGAQGGRPYVVSELLEGRTLRDRLVGGPLPLKLALDYARQIATGLAAAHAKGIVHRDVKPENLFITSDGRLKLLDFGLAKLRETGAEAGQAGTATATSEHAIVGTVQYMAPEQVRGQSVDARTDLFAFGIVLFEMLVAARPFDQSTSADTMSAILTAEAPDIANRSGAVVPPTLAAIVARCLEKDPAARFQSASDLAFALGSIDVALSGAQASEAPAFRWAWVALAAVGIGGVILGAMTLFGSGASSTTTRREPVRAQVAVSDGLRIPSGPSVTGIGLAISDDGTTLVYPAIGADGRQLLYVRRLDESTSRVLPGTEGGFAPFLSPDGEWVAFVAQGGLHKIAIRGGQRVTLQGNLPVAILPYSSGHWFGPDRMAFSDGTRLRVLSSDGQEQSVLGEAADRVWGVLSAQVLPDRQHLLYELWPMSDREEDAEIVVQSLSGGERRTVVKGATTPKLSGSHLIYQTGGRTYAVAFDVQALKTSGTPVAILGSEPGRRRLASTTSTMAYYVGPTSGLRRLEWLDRQGHREPVNIGLDAFTDVALSPNEKSIVVANGRSNHLLWMADATGGTASRLTLDFHSHGPLFSPDGGFVVFQGGPKQSLYRIRLSAGSMPERLQSADTAQIAGSWTPDGKTLLYGQIDLETKQDLWTLNVDSGRSAPLIKTRFNENFPTLSPDGRWLAYTSDEAGRQEVYLQPYPGPGLRRAISSEGGSRPAWSPDGRRLYWQTRDALWEVDVTPGAALSIGTPHALVSGLTWNAGGNRTYAVAKDGRFLIVEALDEPPVSTINLVLNWDVELERLTRSVR